MPPKLDEESATERVQIVAPASWVQRVEEWRRKQPRIPNRSEAIRLLVEAALDAEKG
jgi:metal-responsive CopG/Arc/MetJ family transcriptional regulator